MTTVFIILLLAASFVLFYRALVPVKQRGITIETIEKQVSKIKEQNAKGNTYPKFIPFYEWHGFIKGLHPENRRYVLTNGKQGKKPKKWA